MKRPSAFTLSENSIYNLLRSNIGNIVNRDQVARAIWNSHWVEKYSDWTIDTLIYRLRKKLPPNWKLTTVRNRGLVLSPKAAVVPAETFSILRELPYTFPTVEYLSYMNNPENIRKVLSDLFTAVRREGLEQILLSKLISSDPARILVIDSYSADNIDSLISWINSTPVIDPQIFFTGFDERSLQLHRERLIGENPCSIEILYDDIRQSKIKTRIFDLVINDFRLNFNTSHDQNVLSVKNMHRVLKTGGYCLVSVVVDPRYESERFGPDQEKAPLNIHSPGTFYADEHLTRNCHTVPYYKTLFQKSGFTIISEFDILEGKSWITSLKTYTPTTGPSYRRFLIQSV